MAKLTKCEDCGKVVSVNAVTCPNCGSPIQAQLQNQLNLKRQKEEEIQQKIDAFKNRPESQKKQEKILLSFIVSMFICLYAFFKFSENPLMAIFLIIGSALICIPVKNFIQLKNPNFKNWILNLIGGLLLFIGFMEIIGTKESVSNPQPSNNIQAPSTVKQEDIIKPQEVAKKDYSKIVVPYTKKNMPKLYASWGANWINKINNMMPKVVEKAAQNPKCDEPEMVDIADNRSIVKKEAVFFVDCKNGERLYISQNDLNANAIVKAESEQLEGEPSNYIQPCREAIQAKLQFPSSFDDELLSITARKMPSGNIEVIIPFTAKNGIGNELSYTGRCLITTRKEIEVSLENR